MPIYTYCCPVCGTVNDEQRLMAERNLVLKCACGCSMDRVFTAPAIGGDLPATGWRQNVAGYDSGLDAVVLDESHRQRLMKEKGLKEYSPDPEMKKIRDEQAYVKKHGKGKDANVALGRLAAEATRKRRNTNVSKVVKDGLKDL